MKKQKILYKSQFNLDITIFKYYKMIIELDRKKLNKDILENLDFLFKHVHNMNNKTFLTMASNYILMAEKETKQKSFSFNVDIKITNEIDNKKVVAGLDYILALYCLKSKFLIEDAKEFLEKTKKEFPLVRHNKNEIQLSKNSVPSFHISSLFLTKTALNNYTIKNIDILEKDNNYIFLKDLSKYEKLIFLYAAQMYRQGITKIKYNPTEIKNYLDLESSSANSNIIKAFETLKSKRVVLYNKKKERIAIGVLLNFVEYDVTGKELPIFHIDSNIIDFFTHDEIYSNYIDLNTITLKQIGKLTAKEHDYIMSLMYIGKAAYIKAHPRKYKDFINAFIGIAKENESRALNSNNKDKTGTLRKFYATEKKTIIKILKLLQKSKAFYITIKTDTFTIQPHSKNKKKKLVPKKKI